MKTTVKFAKVKDGAIIPQKREEDAGYDIFACSDESIIVVNPLETKMIPTGIASAFSDDFYFQIQERGSTGSKGMKYGAGVIDSGYRGEWFIPITNTTNKPIIFDKHAIDVDTCDDGLVYPMNKAFCQAVLLPVPKTTIEEISYDELKNIPSERGMGKLDSTSKNK